MKKSLWTLLVATFLTACTIEPKPIAFGEEFCHFCKMTIVDNQHAAQLVTDKGKVFNFDAIECMIHFYNENRQTEMAFIMVNDYLNPGKFIEAKNATFIISVNIPSPMGANLSAVESPELGERLIEGKSGQLYLWEELLTKNDLP